MPKRMRVLDEHPRKLILPATRRQALQASLRSLPRYADPSKITDYQTSAALKVVEDQVSAGAIPEDLLESDAAILGAVAMWAAIRNAEELAQVSPQLVKHE